MILGCDYSFSRPDVQSMASDGVKFACRYLRDGPAKAGKALDAAEAGRLRAAGLAIVSNDETTGVQYRGGYLGGRQDAQAALAAHVAAGGPRNRPVYFSPLDHDPASLDGAGWTLLREYARGAHDILGPLTGWYGGTLMLRDLRARGLGHWWWQALGWRQDVWLDWAHIQQYQNGVTRWGGLVDYDRALTADYGQWPLDQGDFLMADAQQVLDYLANLRQDLVVRGTTGLEQTVEHFAQRQRDTLGKLADLQDRASRLETAVGEVERKLDAGALVTLDVSGLTADQLAVVGQAAARALVVEGAQLKDGKLILTAAVP